MTQDEAQQIKPGDLFTRDVGNVIRPLRCPRDIGWASENACRGDPESANVFADWLDEQGHAEAAAALRTAFPLAKPEEVPGW